MESIETVRSIIMDSLTYRFSLSTPDTGQYGHYALSKSDFGRVEEHLEKLIDEYKQMNEEIKQLKDKNKELKRKMNKTIVDNTNTTIQISRLKREKISLETDINRSKIEQEKTTTDRDRLEKEKTTQIIEKNKAKEENDRLKKEKSELKMDVNKLEKDKKETATEKDKTEKENGRLNKEKTTLETQIKKLEENIKETTTDRDRIEKENHRLEKEKTKLETEVNKLETENKKRKNEQEEKQNNKRRKREKEKKEEEKTREEDEKKRKESEKKIRVDKLQAVLSDIHKTFSSWTTTALGSENGRNIFVKRFVEWVTLIAQSVETQTFVSTHSEHEYKENVTKGTFRVKVHLQEQYLNIFKNRLPNMNLTTLFLHRVPKTIRYFYWIASLRVFLKKSRSKSNAGRNQGIKDLEVVDIISTLINQGLWWETVFEETTKIVTDIKALDDAPSEASFLELIKKALNFQPR